MMATSALSDLTKMPVMPKFPKAEALFANKPAPEGMIGPSEYQPVINELRTAQTKAAFDVGQADIDLEKAKRQEEATKAEKKLENLQTYSEEIKVMPEMKAYEEISDKAENLAFVPTKDTATDLAAMFSLISIVGMVIGKSNAQRAMSAMNGMLEGYQKGRADLYKKEQIEFDKNLKALQTKLTTAKERLSIAMEVKKTDKEKGDLMATMVLAETESQVLKAMAARQGLGKVQQAIDQTITDMDRFVTLKNNIQKDANARADAAERERRADERARLAREQALALATAKAETKQEGKALTSKQSQEIEGLDSLNQGLEQLKKDFKPEFASFGVAGFGADLAFEAKRRLGDKKAQEVISWWSRYERLQAPNRHALFGATLTGNELKNYQSFTAKKSDSAETVKTFLQDQINYTGSVGNNKRLVYESSGYKVPETKPRDYFSTYTPSEYELGQVIKQGNKTYRIIGLDDPNDPEVEEVK